MAEMSDEGSVIEEYFVRAIRWARGWELHITDPAGGRVGVTQVRRLSGADAMVRDYLCLETGRTPESFALEFTAEVPGGLTDEVVALRADQQEVASRQAELAQRAREVARKLRAAGLTGSEVGAVMGVSEQRASQLLRDAG
jgi:DNA-directed RNA polymerase specialized sigma24 family protein